MRKKGQTIMGMSFGVIFSIIIIIFILAIAGYATNYFLGLSKCSKVGLFQDGLQNEIDKAWTSGIYQGTFPIDGNPLGLPSAIKKVCFGGLTQNPLDSADVQDELLNKYFLDESREIYMYPPDKACDGSLGSNRLDHVAIGGFFCVDVVDGEIDVFRLGKRTTEDVVTISKS